MGVDPWRLDFSFQDFMKDNFDSDKVAVARGADIRKRET
jgi:hypothetical protein